MPRNAVARANTRRGRLAESTIRNGEIILPFSIVPAVLVIPFGMQLGYAVGGNPGSVYGLAASLVAYVGAVVFGWKAAHAHASRSVEGFADDHATLTMLEAFAVSDAALTEPAARLRRELAALCDWKFAHERSRVELYHQNASAFAVTLIDPNAATETDLFVSSTVLALDPGYAWTNPVARESLSLELAQVADDEAALAAARERWRSEAQMWLDAARERNPLSFAAKQRASALAKALGASMKASRALPSPEVASERLTEARLQLDGARSVA